MATREHHLAEFDNEVRHGKVSLTPPLTTVERYFSHSQFFIQADCSRRIVPPELSNRRASRPDAEIPKILSQQCRRDSAPTRYGMDNQVFDEGTGPALGDSDNVCRSLTARNKVGGKLVIISKAGPPLFKCPNVASALSVADLK